MKRLDDFWFKDHHIYLDYKIRKGICELCDKKGTTHLHHIAYDDNEPLAYTIEVCISCHAKEHQFGTEINRRNGKFVKCFTCGKEIYRRQSQLLRQVHHFCSKTCLVNSLKIIHVNPIVPKLGRFTKCNTCGKDIYKPPTRKNNTKNYCSSACRFPNSQYSCNQNFKEDIKIETKN